MVSSFVLGFIMFIAISGALVSIAQQSNIIPTTNINVTASIQQANQQIGQSGLNNTSIYTIGTSANTGSNPNCPAVTSPLSAIEYAGCQISNAINAFKCNNLKLCKSLIDIESDPNSTNTLTAQIYTPTNNPVVTILSNPISQALAIALVFVGLGLLAGTLGAGIMANVIATTGIAVALFYYVNAQMSIFGNIPLFIWLPMNAIVGVFDIVIIWESLQGGITGH